MRFRNVTGAMLLAVGVAACTSAVEPNVVVDTSQFRAEIALTCIETDITVEELSAASGVQTLVTEQDGEFETFLDRWRFRSAESGDIVVSIYSGNAESQARRFMAEFGATEQESGVFGGGPATSPDSSPFRYRVFDNDAMVMFVLPQDSQIPLTCLEDALKNTTLVAP